MATYVAPLSAAHFASETLGPICLSYVAQGVFIISSQEPTSGRVDRRSARAA